MSDPPIDNGPPSVSAMAAQLIDQQAELDALREYVGNNMLRSDYQSVDHMRQTINHMKSVCKKENALLKQRVAELLAVCEEMSSSLDAAIFQFPRSVGKGRLVSAYTQMLAAIAPESEVT